MREVIDTALAVVVRTSDDRYRRRVYLSLKPAENAARRAREAGHEAEVILVQLHPVATLEPLHSINEEAA